MHGRWPLTEGGAEQGFRTDATGHVKRLAQEAFREDDLLKPRRWGVYLDIMQRLAYPLAWPEAHRPFLAARAAHLTRALLKPPREVSQTQRERRGDDTCQPDGESSGRVDAEQASSGQRPPLLFFDLWARAALRKHEAILGQIRCPDRGLAETDHEEGDNCVEPRDEPDGEHEGGCLPAEDLLEAVGFSP